MTLVMHHKLLAHVMHHKLMPPDNRGYIRCAQERCIEWCMLCCVVVH